CGFCIHIKGSQCSSGRSKTQVLKPSKARFSRVFSLTATRRRTLRESRPIFPHSVAGKSRASLENLFQAWPGLKVTPTRPYTGDIPETRTLSIFYKLKETDRGSPEAQRVGSNVAQQVRVTQPVSVAAAALESRGPLAPASGHNREKDGGLLRLRFF